MRYLHRLFFLPTLIIMWTLSTTREIFLLHLPLLSLLETSKLHPPLFCSPPTARLSIHRFTNYNLQESIFLKQRLSKKEHTH